jgi:hypothetical protein
MKKLRNFKCAETGEVFERLVEDERLIVECKCNGLANRQVSSGKVIGNTTGRSPSFSNVKQR